MKRLFYIPIATIVLVGAFTIGAEAQTVSGQKVLAKIPFAFSVGKASLPAGKYTITVLNNSSDRKILQIRSVDGRASAMVLTTGVTGTATDDAKLVFDRYGDRYFFAQARLAGDPTSLAAVKSSAERASRRALAKTGKKTVIEITTE
jgi:hypothetical protein